MEILCKYWVNIGNIGEILGNIGEILEKYWVNIGEILEKY